MKNTVTHRKRINAIAGRILFAHQKMTQSGLSKQQFRHLESVVKVAGIELAHLTFDKEFAAKHGQQQAPSPEELRQ